MINRYTNVIDQDNLQSVLDLVSVSSSRPWHFQTSLSNSYNTFFISYLNQTEIDCVIPLLKPSLDRYSPNGEFILERAYINCHPSFSSGEWHVDGNNGLTLLYYPPTVFNFGDKGGTDFELHGEEKYVPNSLIIFPAWWNHRAVEHTVPGAYRFSIAVKLKDKYPKNPVI